MKLGAPRTAGSRTSYMRRPVVGRSHRALAFRFELITRYEAIVQPKHPAVACALILLSAVLAGCALTGGTLGGREKCWPESDQRGASLWRGTLQVDDSSARLDTPEGDVIPLLPGALTMRSGESGAGELVRGSDVIARTGDDVTLFGGMAADGTLIVCDVEEIHAR
jgi:hypothetical protein